KFYHEATARHPKLPLARRYEYGFSFCVLPKEFDAYYMKIEASARRNHKKALRLGYQVRRFEVNDYLDDIREIWKSRPVRQAELPKNIREGLVQPTENPASRTPYHDYVHFGAFKEGKLRAYVACLIAGELCEIADVYGHADYQGDGIVPL